LIEHPSNTFRPSELPRVFLDAPAVETRSDYEAFFTSLVISWIRAKRGPFQHEKVVITAGPLRPYYVAFRSTTENGQKTLYLDFYSAARVGFGNITADEEQQIIGIL
jgi:hypothetical protein